MGDAGAVISDVIRRDRGRILSALIGTLRDFDLAEESLADAVESAVVHWGRSGTPDNPRAWLMRVARRKAIDRIRRRARFADRVQDIEMLAAADQEAAGADAPDIPDERLALIFTCCHPVLDRKSRIALTLRTLCGLSTGEVAQAFLDKDATMGQRLSRAKARIASAGITFAVPEKADWDERLDCVLTVIYLIYNRCYDAGDGQDRADGKDNDLCGEAIYLARMLNAMLPDDPEVTGLLGLLLLTDARRPARRDASGVAIPLPDQDGTLWVAAERDEGLDLLDATGPVQVPGPFLLQARIAAEHMRHGPGRADWLRVLALYDRLLLRLPTPVVALNRAVAVAEVHGPAAALELLAALETQLADYQPFHATRAAILARVGRLDEARAAYDRAIADAPSPADAALLTARRDALSTPGDRAKKMAETSSAKSNREV